jgi:hypothetical protein
MKLKHAFNFKQINKTIIRKLSFRLLIPITLISIRLSLLVLNVLLIKKKNLRRKLYIRPVMEVPAAYPRIACGTLVARRGLGESCDAASVQYSGFSNRERGSNFPIKLLCGVLL